ncbi:DUF5667 domain-containing protein [Marmoricola sp. RAF53]|uniref:DUF5667 domain-containing protein n=1 Tax=Marmoricola sp. RAF53 TaxID=3233059 RepID=UPI003F9CF1E2
MTPLSPARRAAEEFASVVDGTRGDVADRYADLLTFVDVLRAQEMPAPRPDFVANLRTRLLDAADTHLVPADAPALAPVVPLHDAAKRRQRRISVAAAAFVIVGGTAGVAAAAESALPGDPLYPLKRGIESAQASFSSSDSGKGQDLLRQASTRLDEVDHLIADDKQSDKVAPTLNSFKESATNGADLIFMAYQRDGDPEDITRLRTILGAQLLQLDKLAPQAGASKGDIDAARGLVRDLDQQARVLCNCGPDALSLSSAPALSSLLALPADAASSFAGQADADSDLASKANQIAKNTPQGTKTTGPSAGPSPTGTPSPNGKPSADPSQVTKPVQGVVGGLTAGVSSLLDEVGNATGGALSPVTDVLSDTLNTLGGALDPKTK